MRRNAVVHILLRAVLVIFLIFSYMSQTAVLLAQTLKEAAISYDDRILILAPHPDDEILGCAGIIQKAVSMGIPLKIVFLTYGDNNQWSFMVYRKRPVLLPKAVQNMGLVRSEEAIEACKELGVSKAQIIFLGYPDFRTLNIWYSYWGDSPPVRSMLTRTRTVPYKNAYRPRAPYKGDEILKDMESILKKFKPTKIFVSHPGDFNPDHRALYLFCRIALWNLKNEIEPEVFPYLIHYKRWPQPEGDRPSVSLNPPGDLKNHISWYSALLSKEEIERKRNALKKHRSQYQSNSKYLLSFVRRNELFGDFPIINLGPKGPPAILSAVETFSNADMPEELTDVEEEFFVGLESGTVNLQDNNLIITVSLSKRLNERAVFLAYIFGYSDDRDFAEMPKLCVRLSMKTCSVLDGRRRLPRDIVKIERDGKTAKIYIPLEVLGNPRYILTSARTHLDDIPLDWFSWRVLGIKNDTYGRSAARND